MYSHPPLRAGQEGTMDSTLHDLVIALMAARTHAQSMAERHPQYGGAVDRFEEEVKQAEKELIMKIRSALWENNT
jgi:hypothetical protein